MTEKAGRPKIKEFQASTGRVGLWKAIPPWQKTTAQIHKLIIEGYNIRVLDAKTNEDITPKVLTRHALIALCLYCLTGDELIARGPDTGLLESNRKSIRIPLPHGTGDPLHAAFEIVQQLALQGPSSAA